MLSLNMNNIRSFFFSLLVFGSAAYSQRIDTHFHALPPAYLKALSAAGGDPSGYPTPEWSLDAAMKSMDMIETSLGKHTWPFLSSAGLI